MGTLTEAATWAAGVPYFEMDAILTGGPDCPDNIPIQALANRTAFLKKQIDDAVNGALTVMYANRLKAARTISMSGDGTWSVSFDGNGNVTSAMTLANTTVVAGTYPVITVDGKGRATGGRALQSADLPASPALTGTPTAPTAAAGTNTTQLANTAFVQAAIAALIASSPAALDTLNELAAALGDDPNFATTMTNALAAKAPLASPALTGNPTAPTPTTGDNDTSLATTAFVQALVNGRLSKSVAGGVTVTLTAAEAGYGIIEFTGALTANIAVVVPNASGQWIFKNATTGAYALTVKTAAGTGVAITQGTAWQVYCDGTNVINGISDFKDLALTGTPTAPTPAPGTNNTQVATAAFVQAAINGVTGGGVVTSVAGKTGAVSLTVADVAGAAPATSPTFTGMPAAPTAVAGTNTTQLATTAFVQATVAALIASSPAALDTLNELATALGNDPNFATTMTNSLAAKAPLASPALTGTPTAPTAAASTNTTQLATTAFVQQEIAGDLATATPLMAGAGAVGTATKLAREDHRHPTDTTRAPLASPVFTGTPAAPTAVAGTNTTQLATTAFVQAADAAMIASAPCVQGAYKNLRASATGTNATVTVTADEIALKNSSNSYAIARAVALAINSATVGANGLDTGVLAASTWYSVWVIWNGATVAGLLSLSATAPTLPGGYTHAARVGWIYTDGTANKYPLPFKQAGRRVRYTPAAGTNLSSPRIVASGAQGSTTAPTFVPASVASVLPPTAIFGAFLGSANAVSMSAAPNNTYGGYTSMTNTPPIAIYVNGGGTTEATMPLESGNIYYAASGAAAVLYCTGWEDNI